MEFIQIGFQTENVHTLYPLFFLYPPFELQTVYCLGCGSIFCVSDLFFQIIEISGSLKEEVLGPSLSHHSF